MAGIIENVTAQDWRTRMFPPPVAPTRAGSWLRRLIVLTAVAVIVVEALNLISTDEPGFSLLVRTAWALLRVIGFLLLLRLVRFGRAGARPFGLILAITTVFAVARLAEPTRGSFVPRTAVIIGFVVLAGLCAVMVWALYRHPGVDAHLSTRPMRRHIPAWVLTARVAVISLIALIIVPLLVAAGDTFSDDRRQPVEVAVPLLVAWLAMALVLGFIVPPSTLFLLQGKAWARWLAGLVSVVALVVQPFLCYLLLGADGLLRDGVPLILTAVLALVALHRSRGLETWVRRP